MVYTYMHMHECTSCSLWHIAIDYTYTHIYRYLAVSCGLKMKMQAS